jgi:vacuolar-type H+-ATPase subunit F/Vma7
MSSTGAHVPPLVVIRGKYEAELMNGAPAVLMAACHSSGCVQKDIFIKWFDHFVHFIKPSEDVRVLLIVDGHYSNTKNLDVVYKVKEHSVAIVSLPSHSKHKMQPIDVGFMKSIKHTMHKKLKRV